MIVSPKTYSIYRFIVSFCVFCPDSSYQGFLCKKYRLSARTAYCIIAQSDVDYSAAFAAFVLFALAGASSFLGAATVVFFTLCGLDFPKEPAKIFPFWFFYHHVPCSLIYEFYN